MLRWFRAFLPREERFFDLFARHAETVVQGARALQDMLRGGEETPAEPVDSKFYLTVKVKAYPVQKWLGLYWTYMGPTPAPPITRFDVWARKDGTHRITVQPQLDCNWFQAMENSVDPAHLPILHQETSNQGRKPGWSIASSSFGMRPASSQ